MDYSLISGAQQLSPEQQQQLVAQALRRSNGAASLQQANANANRFSQLAAISQMANNQGIANAAELANKNAQAQYKPLSLGQMGFALPSSGEFVESPMYRDERNAQRQSQQDIANSRIEAQAQAQRERLQAQADRAGEMSQLRLALEGMRSADRQDSMNLRRDLADEKAAAKREAAAKGKALPGSDVRALTDKESSAGSLLDLSNSFKDEFAGTPKLATLQNTLGRYQPLGYGTQYADQSNWWQNYNDQKNKIRHQLFGSALTAAEQAAFDAANITEGMDSKEIRRRLTQQHQASVRAYNKLVANYGRGGYDMSQFNSLVEPATPLPGAGKPRPGDKYLNQ